MQFASVNAAEVAQMSPFDSESFPNCVALASDRELVIGTVDSIQPKDCPRAIAGVYCNWDCRSHQTINETSGIIRFFQWPDCCQHGSSKRSA